MKKVLSFFITVLLLRGVALHAQSGSISVRFAFQFQGKPFEPGKTYKSISGEPVQLNQIRFYVGEPYAIAADDRPPEINTSDQFWLIDSKDTSSLKVTFPVDAGLPFSGITFRIGVDSANQVRGARTGALDPLKGMYWTWNSGYVAVKIEGNSSATTAAGGQLEYHLGGYRSPNAVSRLITVKSAAPFTVAAHNSVDVVVPVELDHFFPADFSLKEMPTMMTPGAMAKQLMKQFATCFLPIVLSKPGE